jgi:hypothetical protein
MMMKVKLTKKIRIKYCIIVLFPIPIYKYIKVTKNKNSNIELNFFQKVGG